jgi:hypothetical protein
MEAKKREPGRPPKPLEERRRKPLRIRLTDAERELLDDAAGGEEGTSTWAREVLLRAARKAKGGTAGRGGDGA